MEKTEVHIEQVRRANEKWVKLWYKKARQIVLFRKRKDACRKYKAFKSSRY